MIEGTTQGDPLVMAMYALAVTPLMKKLQLRLLKFGMQMTPLQVGPSLISSHGAWENLVKHGPEFRCFPMASKSIVVVKHCFEDNAHSRCFCSTDLSITLDGNNHLGIPLGTIEYKNRCIDEKVSEWCRQVEKLALFARSQPHAAYIPLYTGVTSS